MPAGQTYTPIATYTADGSTNPITFSSIPGTYTDLRFVLSVNANQGTTSGYSNFSWRYNSNAANNYSATTIEGNGSSATSNRYDSGFAYTFGLIGGTQITGNTGFPTLITYDIFSYANTSTNKSAVFTAAYNRDGSGGVQKAVTLWNQTSAITSVTFDIDGFGGVSGRAFKSGSTFTLYGITAA
jgi:hypothetical protein